MGELGFFHGQKVELIEGRLMVFAPQNPPHSSGVFNVQMELMRVFQAGYIVRQQFPLDLGQSTEPEPDVAVVAGTGKQYTQAHPTTAELIVEVSDTTLSYDRGRKGSLYARAGVADYWVLNLISRQVEIYRAPIPDSAEPYGWRYSARIDVPNGCTVSPRVAPDTAIVVVDLLP